MNQPLTRSASDKFIAGVCGGIARSLGMDASIVRIITVVLAVFFQFGWVAYIVLWLVLPLEQNGPTGFDSLRRTFSSNSSNNSDLR